MEFFSRYKKIFLATGFIAIVILLGYALYAVFFRPAAVMPPSGQKATSTGGGGLPIASSGPGQIVGEGGSENLPTEPGTGGGKASADTVAQGRLTETTPLSGLPVIGATISADGSDVQFYNKADGKFYRVDKNGGIEELSGQIFHQVDKVTWSPDKESAVLEYPDGSNIIYNFSTKKQVTLPAHWKEFSYSPAGDNIVLKSIGNDPDASWLAIVSNDGSKVRTIEQIGKNEASVYPSWSPGNQIVAMYTEGVDFDRQEVYFVGQNEENFKSTVVEGRGFEPLWSPDGSRLLYSVYSTRTDLKPSLWIVDAQGESIGSNRRDLGTLTWADKCAFADGTTAYCAVPETLEEGAGLFPELAQNTVDRLYRLDLATGAKKLVAIPDGSYTIDNIIVSADSRNLFFNDKNSGRLYKIKLK